MMATHASPDQHNHTGIRTAFSTAGLQEEEQPLDSAIGYRHDAYSQATRRKAAEADAILQESATAESQSSPRKQASNTQPEYLAANLGDSDRLARDSTSWSGTDFVSDRQEYGRHGHSVPQPHIDHNSSGSNPAVKSLVDNSGQFDPGLDCPTHRDFHSSRFTWVNASIISICCLSTALSALFVLLALKSQRYGAFIGNELDSKIRISTAILLTSIVAKTIELTFVTAFVAFLGQVISRKAFIHRSGHGVTLSEMTMWRWVVQPGSLFTQSEVARYAGFSFLGILTLLCTVLSTLYVTAATTLVQPVSKESEWHSRTMAGSVTADFASLRHIQDSCKLPIAPGIDDMYLSSTCMQISHAARSMFNEQSFLAEWKDFSQSSGTSDQTQRPVVIGLQYANSTVVPQWIDIINTTKVSNQYQRVINNVTLALPHVGVADAVHNRRNDMPQSENSDSVGPYSLWASVPSPTINVLCVHMTKAELDPIVFSSWPSNMTVNGTNWFTTGNITTWNASHIMDAATTANKTAVDDIFEWHKEDTVTMVDYPPVFPLLPKPFNTVLNHTSHAWGRSAIYILGQGANPEGDPSYRGPDLTNQYPLCRIKAGITPRCSTRYSISVAGSKVEALCDDHAGDMAYATTNASATAIVGHPNWRDLGADWASSLSLHTGISDGYASNNRLLMQLLLTPDNEGHIELDPKRPSLAEVLASLASDTLILGTKDAPFVEYFNYTLPSDASSLVEAEQQWFQAKIKSQEYASGGVDRATKAWLAVLILTFVINALMLVYFIVQPGLVTDFSQPPQLFALAINSPPAKVLAGSCGAGPEGEQYKIGWIIDHEGEHLFMQPHPDASTALLADGYDSGSSQTSSIKADKGKGPLASLSPTLNRAKQNLRFRINPMADASPGASVELLRSPSRNESAPSLQSQYELEHFGNNRNYSRLSQDNDNDH